MTAYPLDMSALVDFLNVRVDEDEQIALAAERGNWVVGPNWGARENRVYIQPEGSFDWVGTVLGGERPEPDLYADDRTVMACQTSNKGQLAKTNATHIARHDPERARRDVAAKRSHIVRFQQVDDLIPESPPGIIRNELLSVRRAYALVLLDDATCYCDHKDYRPEWQPISKEGDDDA